MLAAWNTLCPSALHQPDLGCLLRFWIAEQVILVGLSAYGVGGGTGSERGVWAIFRDVAQCPPVVGTRPHLVPEQPVSRSPHHLSQTGVLFVAVCTRN